MLAGCSSSALLSPRHRLRSEGSTQFQACHIPTMSTQRLDIPCSGGSFGRKDSSRSQPEKPNEAKVSLRQNVKHVPLATESKREVFWDKGVKKRYAEEDDDGYMCSSRVKRKRKEKEEEEGHLSQFSEGFWFHSTAAPSHVIAPPLPPLSSIPWFDSVVTQITDFGKNKDVETIKGPDKDTSASSSSTSTGTRGGGSGSGGGLVVGNPTEHEIGNGSSPHNPTEVIAGEHKQREHDYFELISLLVACTEQIGSKNMGAVNHCLARLGQLASPRGSPVHRLTAYFTEALALRAARLWPHIFHVAAAPREDDDNGTALRVLNQVSPIPKLIHFTSNEILLRAFEGKDRVHVIDFDVKQGLQWPSLFQSLATRPRPPSHVRITGVGESKQELIETGERLARFAEAFDLPFEFHSVVDRLEDVRLWMLHVKEGETVAVNCVFQLHKMLYDSTGGALRDFLGLIRSTNAVTVITAEQEAAHNEASLDARMFNSLRYYSAIFDVVDSGLPLDSAGRVKIEEMFAREIRNIIGCEGRDRTERHETFDRWREMMEQGGYRCVGVGEREVLQGEMMLKMYEEERYRVEKRETGNGSRGSGGGVTLCWLDQPLYTVSAWTPVDLAGGSYTR